MDADRPDLFRPEAVEHHVQAHQRRGDVLRISPAWTRWTYWVLLLAIAAALVYLAVGTMPEYAEGPAVIWVERAAVTAKSAGTVIDIETYRGQTVKRGYPLVRYRGGSEPGQYHHIRAPREGIVGDIRIRPGQRFSSGDELMYLLSTTEDGGRLPYVIAMLPARYLPLLDERMPLRLELTGYPYVYHELEIEWMGDEAVGPGAVRRYLGQDLADSVMLRGPVVLVRARMSQPTFKSDGQWRRCRHGMQGTAAVQVRSESILLTLVPWLKKPFADNDD